MEPWQNLIKNIEVDLPVNGKTAPSQEYIAKEIIKKKVRKTTANNDPKVIVQKINTEVWIYTDTEGKTVATMCLQDIAELGEMAKSEALKMINARKAQRKKETE